MHQVWKVILLIGVLSSLIIVAYSGNHPAYAKKLSRTIELLGNGDDNRRTLGFLPGSGIAFKYLLSCPLTTATRQKANFELAHNIPMRFSILYPEIGDAEPINIDRRDGEADKYNDGVWAQLVALGYGALRKSGELFTPVATHNVTESHLKEIYFEDALKRDRLRSRIERKFFYTDFESLLSKMGLPGKPCLLRTICEVASDPFDDGLFGELLNILLMASFGGHTEYSDENLDYNEYINAEEFGRNSGNCAFKYGKCKNSVFILMHDIIEDLFS